MSDTEEDINDSIRKQLDLECSNDRAVVVSEIPISNTQLHHIATGKICQIGQPEEPFAVRFLLKSSFKSSSSNYVVNNYIMQIIAVGKNNVMRKQDMDLLTKVKTVTKTKIVDKKEELSKDFEINKGGEVW